MGTLQHGEAYGYEIFQRSDRVDWLSMPESTVYAALRRLRREGLVATRSVRSSDGPSRKYYRLTSRGRRRFREMKAEWRKVVGAVEHLLAREQKD